MAALKHEVPALLATAVIHEGSFAERLDKAIARSNGARLIEHKPTIEAESEPTPIEPKPTLPAPLSRLYSNKFRRRF